LGASRKSFHLLSNPHRRHVRRFQRLKRTPPGANEEGSRPACGYAGSTGEAWDVLGT